MNNRDNEEVEREMTMLKGITRVKLSTKEYTNENCVVVDFKREELVTRIFKEH